MSEPSASPDERPDDRELIDLTIAGDGNAFAILVERFQRSVFRVAFAIVRDESDADGVAQDTFVQAYTHLKRFEGRAGLGTWLTRIAINRSRDVLRRRRLANLFTLTADGEGHVASMPEPIDERPDPERQVMSAQLQAAIDRAEKKLSAQQKVIFRLRHYENLPLEEIAAHLDMNPATVRTHLFRAIQKIRKELAGWRPTRRIEHEPALQ